MLNPLIETTLELRACDSRASYFIAKELALIEIALLWYPENFGANLSRLKSLASHVKITFKKNDIATKLAADIRTMVAVLQEKAA